MAELLGDPPDLLDALERKRREPLSRVGHTEILTAGDLFPRKSRGRADLPPFISGRASRVALIEDLIGYVRRQSGVWFTTCEEVARWHDKQRA